MAAPEYDTLLNEPKADTACSMYNNTDPALFTNVVHPSAAAATGKIPETYCGKWSWIIAMLGCPCIICCPVDEIPRD
tara:strand:+ start:202 stop:432 length:231 start_codon:yes stop_codon:yes gene_type:complete